MLTVKQIEAMSKAKVDKLSPDGTPNLYVHARASGTINWICRVSTNQSRAMITLGSWPKLSPNRARTLAPMIASLVREGRPVQAIRNALRLTPDPNEIRSLVVNNKVLDKKKTPTFEDIAHQWYALHLKNGLSDGPYKTQVINQLRDHVFPSLGRRAINQIKRAEIIDAIRLIWVDKYPTGKKVRGNIERVFDYAIDLELLESNPTPPVRSMPKHQHSVRHFASLPYERAQELWHWLCERPRMSVQTRIGISLALLLGKRTNEIRTMRWEHIDFDQAIWTTPYTNMKQRKEHRQPLCHEALDLLSQLREISGDKGYVLAMSHERMPSPNTMLKAIKDFDAITVHGFRATLGTWGAEQGVDYQVMEFIKAHQPKYLDAAYQRSDLLKERRLVLQQWADFVTAP